VEVSTTAKSQKKNKYCRKKKSTALERTPMSAGRRRYHSSSSDCGPDRRDQLEGYELCMGQIAASLLPVALPLVHVKDVFEKAPLVARLAIAAGTSQLPALSRAALNWKDNGWLSGMRSEPITDDDTPDEDWDAEAASLHRIRFNTGVAHVATRLLELAPRAVPEIVLYPCPDGRIGDITRMVAATQPGTVRRFALRNFVGPHAEAMEIWELACATWGPSSLRDLRFDISHASEQCLRELCATTAQCPHLEVLSIPILFLPPSFVAPTVEGSLAAAPSGCLSGLCLPLPIARRFDFAPYAATLRSLELSNGPDNAAEFAFIATQLPSLRCLAISKKGRAQRIPSAVWRRGMRQLLGQLHKLYIFSLCRPLCHALNTLHDFATYDAQRSSALRLPPGAMSTILQSDDDDDVAPVSSTPVDGNAAEDIPLQVFSICGFNSGGPHSTAPFLRYLGLHAPCLTEVGLSRSTADTAAELMTMRGPCRTVDLRDVRGLTDTIVASILKRHRATLRQLVVAAFVEVGAAFDPRAYMDGLGDAETPQGAPFTKITSVSLQLGWSREKRAYFAYLFPRLCDDPRTMNGSLFIDL
jgi:hypothetical protein